MTLPPPVFASVPPPADGLRLAFGAARRRRNGKAAVAGGAGVLVVSFLLSLGGTAGNQTLLQEPLPPARGGVPLLVGPAPSPAPSPIRRADPAVASALATDPGAPLTTAQGLRRAAADGSVTLTSTRSRSRTAGSTAPPGPVSGPMTREKTLTVPGDVTCPIRKQSERSQGLCTDVWVLSGKDQVTLEALLCSTEPSDVTLTYETAKEVDVAVLAGSREVWRWSVGRQLAATPHSLVLQAGDCFTWRTSWRVVDQRSRALPPGTYQVRAEFFAAQVSRVERVATVDYRRS